MVALEFIDLRLVLLVQGPDAFVSFIHSAVLREFLRLLDVLKFFILLKWVVLHHILLVWIDELKNLRPISDLVREIWLIAQISPRLVNVLLLLVPALGHCYQVFDPDLSLLLVVVICVSSPSWQGP